MKDATNTSFVPPAGWVTREQAGRRFGVSGKTWSEWEYQGKLQFGQWFALPRGGRMRLYPLEEVEAMLREHATFPPAGMVDRHAAAQMFGVAARTWSEWEHAGRITCGRLVSVPGKMGVQKIYPVDELRRLVEVFKVEAARAVESFPPAGMIDRHEACRMFGIAIRTWVTWESEGKVDCAKWFKIPGKPGRCKLYPVEEIRRRVEELREEERRLEEARKPYPDPARPGCWRVPICSGKHEGMEAIIDEESLPLVEGNRWWWNAGSLDEERGTVGTNINGIFFWLHQMVMGVQGMDYRVGHLNGDPLDCRRANLVVRTHSEQKASARKALAKRGKACSSRYKGVHWNPEGCKWSATITQRGRTRQLGRYISEIDAALAYDAAALELYGGHARLNFQDPAEAERLRATQSAVEAGTFPPPGMIDLGGACRMFNVPPVTWTAWEQSGRLPVSGQTFQFPSGENCTLYAVEDLNRAQEQIRQLAQPYPDSHEPECYRVPLMSFICYREAIIDARSLPLVEGRRWHWQDRTDGGPGGAVVLTTREGPPVPLARVVAEVATAGFDTRVSHRNRDQLDCRLSNIIVRTMQEQSFGNRKMGTVNGRQYTSKYKGVSWSERSGKWVANIQKDRKVRRLGTFHDEIAAAQAYDEAARELFGEYAWLNFPDGIDAALERAA